MQALGRYLILVMESEGHGCCWKSLEVLPEVMRMYSYYEWNVSVVFLRYVGGYHIIHSDSLGRGVHRLSVIARDLRMPDYSVRTTMYIVCRCEKLPSSTIFCEACISSFSNCVTVYVAVSHLNLVSNWVCLSCALFVQVHFGAIKLFGHLCFMKGAYSGETSGLACILTTRTTWKKLKYVASHDFLRYKCEVHALGQVFHLWHHIEHNIVNSA